MCDEHAVYDAAMGEAMACRTLTFERVCQFNSRTSPLFDLAIFLALADRQGQPALSRRTVSDGTTELVRQEPLYMQVVRQLRAQIAVGELKSGTGFPPNGR